jgi:hypothetical protein
MSASKLGSVPLFAFLSQHLHSSRRRARVWAAIVAVAVLALGPLSMLASAHDGRPHRLAEVGGAQYTQTLRSLRSGVDAAITSDERARAFARALADDQRQVDASAAPELAVRRVAAAAASTLMQQQLDLLAASEHLWISGPLHRSVLTDAAARAVALQRLGELDAAIARVSVPEQVLDADLALSLARFEVPGVLQPQLAQALRERAAALARSMTAELAPLVGYSRALHGLYEFLDRVHGQWSLDPAGTVVAAAAISDELAQRVREVRAAQRTLLGEG